MRRKIELDELTDMFLREAMPLRVKPTEATHDKWTDDNGVDWWVHRWNPACTEEGCAVHCPTDHRMVDWPQVMAAGTLIVRVCPHDVDHPDPDSYRFFKKRGQEHMGVHNCDGCCSVRPGTRTGRGETRSVPAVKYEEEHDVDACGICCNTYGYDMNDIPNGS